MSNEPTQPTLFQQKAQLRLREKEAEWRRTLFERFRHICREEMRDVMQALLNTLRSPKELEQRQEEMRQMHEAMTQTSKQVAELVQRIENLPASGKVNTAALERETKELAERQEQQANRILARQETAFQDIQTATRRSYLKTTLIIALICLGAMLGLKYIGNFSLVNENAIKAQNQLAASTQTNITLLESQRQSLLTEIKNLTVRHEAMQAELSQDLGLQKTIQQQTANLQQLQEQFRFQLVKGATGGVFVEVPPEAQPFTFEGKTYIQVQ